MAEGTQRTHSSDDKGSPGRACSATTARGAVLVAPLAAADHARWLSLARGYKAFYKTETSEAEYAAAWQRLLAGAAAPNGLQVHGLGARLASGGSSPQAGLIGITHFLFHTSVWAPKVCYLQDLYTDPAARGQGVARALIAAVAQAAKAAGAARLYWLTQDDNVTARRLYDQVAVYRGFVRYDHPL